MTIIDRAILIAIAAPLLYLAFIGHIWFNDYNKVKVEMERGAALAEHCRIMRAVGSSC